MATKTRFMTSEKCILDMERGEGGDYIADFIRDINRERAVEPGYFFNTASPIDADIAIAILKALGREQLGNKEFIALGNRAFLDYVDRCHYINVIAIR